MAERVVIRECGPRDGLQGEEPLAPAVRARLANRLAGCGLPEVEAAAFVSPRLVPAMAGAEEVVAALEQDPAASWWALVPNRKGAELARAAGVHRLTVTVSASEEYSRKNVGMPVERSLDEVTAICALRPAPYVDAVVSCAFGSSFGDRVTPDDVGDICLRLGAAGVDRITLADTTGTATPRRISAVLHRTGPGVGLHLHDTRATALTNAYAGLEAGVRRFDTAVGGLGGSPFAPGAGGNLATEDLVLLLEDQGVGTGVDLDRLLGVSRELAGVLGRTLPSRVAAAGPLPPFPAV